MFKINLVPEVQKERLETKKVNTYSTIFAIVLAGIVVGALLILSGITLVKKAQLSSTEKKISDTETELVKYKDLEETVLSLEKGLTGVKQILDGNNRWTKLLPHVEKSTPADVQITTLKMEDNKIEATLESSNINSLAKFLDSLKAYRVVTITGTGTPGTNIGLSVDQAPVEVLFVKSNGTWVYGASFDPNIDHFITVDLGNDKKAELKFTAANKKLESNDPSITAQVNALFSDVQADHYLKKETGIEMLSKFNYDGKAIW